MGRHYVVKRPPDGFISIPDLIRRWDVAETTVRRWLRVRRLELPTRRHNGRRRCIALGAVEEFEAKYGVPLVATS